MEVVATTGAVRRAKLWTVKSSLPANQHPSFYRLDALPVAQPTVSEHKRNLYSISICILLTEERKLSELECPLPVQLNWGKDDREGRFLLKREIDKTTAVLFLVFFSFYSVYATL